MIKKTMENQSPVPPKPNNIEEGSISMTFFAALPLILEGKRITRIAWNDENEYGFLGSNKNIWLHTKGEDHTWEIHETDMTANDWIVVKLKN